MTRPLVDRIADAVLYEGYLLYPYRPSSVKNRQRWTFGGLFPRDCELARDGLEPWSLQAECLLEGVPKTTVRMRARFLHLTQRMVGGQPWQEADDREVELPVVPFEQLATRGVRFERSFPARSIKEPIHDSGDIVGEVVREQRAISLEAELSLVPVRDGLFRLTARVSNVTTPERVDGSREELLPVTLVSSHVILTVTDGSFVSLLDTPEEFREAAQECRNVGVWPVLIGESGERNTILASPIILYDYPQLAPESPGDLFDSTEIDEILTLRILTMTDDEKNEMRAADPRANALLARTESLARHELMRLHGTIRGLRPVSDGGTS
jgi:hypothetical protein